MREKTMSYCKRCNVRFVRAPHSGDFVHNCNYSDSETLKNEDVLDINTSAENPDGTTSTKKAGGNLLQGVENRLFGQRAWVEGEDDETVTTRGKSVNTYRTRLHFEYVPDSQFKN